MVPTMILVGVLIGRWWAVPVSGVAWAVLVVTGASAGIADVPGAAALGAANAGAGVLLRRLIQRYWV
jgi:hypothetical protein